MKTKINITKRDLLFFFIGIAFTVLIGFILNWESNIKDFKEGFNEGYNSTQEKEITH